VGQAEAMVVAAAVILEQRKVVAMALLLVVRWAAATKAVERKVGMAVLWAE
jgi:hypothetical protein